MPANHESLLAGRSLAPLADKDVKRAISTFLGLDPKAPVRYQEAARTSFRVYLDESGQETPEIIFGPDLYPGTGVLDPNSSLSMQAAAAHELTHYARWVDKTELSQDHLFEIDEALTSLESILRFQTKLGEHDIRQLVGDAIQRLQLFAQKNL